MIIRPIISGYRIICIVIPKDNLPQFHWVDFQLYMTAWHFGKQTPTQEPFWRIDRWEICWPPASSTTPTLLRYRAKKTSRKSFGTAVIPYDTPSFYPRQDPMFNSVGVACFFFARDSLGWGARTCRKVWATFFFWKFPFLQTCGISRAFRCPVKKPRQGFQWRTKIREEFFWRFSHLQEVRAVFQVFVYIIFHIRTLIQGTNISPW